MKLEIISLIQTLLNDYVNATKMCRAGGKDHKDWSRLKGTQQMIQSLQRQMALEFTHNNVNTLGDPLPQIWGSPCKYIEGLHQTEQDRLISGT